LKEGKWKKWLDKIQEYDIEIKHLKVVRGKGLCELMTRIDVVNGDISILAEYS
jgi:hypothetical protein